MCLSGVKAQEKQSMADKNGQPSIEFLEYLAEMKEVNGEFLDPLDMQTEICQNLDKRETEKNETTKGQNNVPESSSQSDIQQVKKECENEE